MARVSLVPMQLNSSVRAFGRRIVAASSGIGHVIWSLRRFVKTPEVMAGIVTIGIIGLLTDQAFRYAHRGGFRYLRRS